ncbi:hypothetical protein [Haloarcula argentinensis]|uniref:Glycosyltransferase RgtA/B/C/D-like domain-containing protein n=1 Tax=Haloarcula argentinensis TaxID=43776 RepID=A0A830FKC6_HALAR|nr:hypothetical protein [Haloarcula argentinensis]EMA22234.1 hypothetical protein C443_09767 [Haloarcula argentinensis DSM 12282]MDS0252456.1 hypothetical protein [Haloarcula argentinensis]GGM32162.1 hypothetical protein GCM10009006_12120 [Haloarcula argentinensis]
MQFKFDSVKRDRLLSRFVITGVLGLVAFSFILDRQYPAHFAGFYSEAAETILENEFVYPQRIPNYTSGGTPFGYPPIALYLLAALKYTLPVSWLQISLYLPVIIYLAVGSALVYLSQQELDSELLVTGAVVIAVTHPRYH